jgi:hypothetical protein
MTMIGGCDVVKGYLACGMYPLASDFSFRDVAIGTTTLSKVEMPLPVFPVEAILANGAHRFLAKVETNAEKILGSYGPKEHEKSTGLGK